MLIGSMQSMVDAQIAWYILISITCKNFMQARPML